MGVAATAAGGLPSDPQPVGLQGWPGEEVPCQQRRQGRAKEADVRGIRRGVGVDADEGGVGQHGGGGVVPPYARIGAAGGGAAGGAGRASRLLPQAAGGQGAQTHMQRGAARSTRGAAPGGAGLGPSAAAGAAAGGLGTAAVGGAGLRAALRPADGHVAQQEALHSGTAAAVGLASDEVCLVDSSDDSDVFVASRAPAPAPAAIRPTRGPRVQAAVGGAGLRAASGPADGHVAQREAHSGAAAAAGLASGGVCLVDLVDSSDDSDVVSLPSPAPATAPATTAPACGATKAAAAPSRGATRAAKAPAAAHAQAATAATHGPPWGHVRAAVIRRRWRETMNDDDV